MNSNLRAQAIFRALCVLACLTVYATAVRGQQPMRGGAESSPRVFLLDGTRLQAVRTAIKRGDKDLEKAWSKLQRDAQKALVGDPFSIVNKSVAPPSGDKHDYMSQAPYFWPNPKTPSGLPYIRRDGERNPEINKITDHKSIDDIENAAETLALAYYFTGDEKYASKAVELLRAFFLDPASRMNPNLQYAQFIPGVNTGRGIGLIETRGLTRVVDAIGLLEGSKALTREDERRLKGWFRGFLQWMLDSKNGREESAAKNNHGTWYDVQVVSFALFIGRNDLAKQVLEQAKQKRIATQIEPDGKQPLELARTKAWSYSNGNLDGLMHLATLGQFVGVDLWNFQTKDGRSIRKALDFLVPIAIGEKKWAYQEIEGGVKPETLFPLMRRAAAVYRDGSYQAVMAKVPAADPSDRSRLIHAEIGAGRQTSSRMNGYVKSFSLVRG
ncbi:MAG TPA: alginate lyase family protein [Pyrinomonadaceae bacterium]|nr:alginate lyase family protein [Pyrinomonadaceae bacterium]